MIEKIINDLLNNFDFGYMFIINIITYYLIHLVQSANEKKLSILIKRLLLICSIIIVTSIYKILNSDIDNIILLNSAILSPISWSWIFKPIVNLIKTKYNVKNNKN